MKQYCFKPKTESTAKAYSSLKGNAAPDYIRLDAVTLNRPRLGPGDERLTHSPFLGRKVMMTSAGSLFTKVQALGMTGNQAM